MRTDNPSYSWFRSPLAPTVAVLSILFWVNTLLLETLVEKFKGVRSSSLEEQVVLTTQSQEKVQTGEIVILEPSTWVIVVMPANNNTSITWMVALEEDALQSSTAGNASAMQETTIGEEVSTEDVYASDAEGLREEQCHLHWVPALRLDYLQEPLDFSSRYQNLSVNSLFPREIHLVKPFCPHEYHEYFGSRW